MPKQSQKTPATPGPLQRRFTTLSLEALNRISTVGEAQERTGGPHGVFTENLSASSRAAPPPFVVRHGTVVGANMPETVQLAAHRGKVYIGLQDPVSASTRLSGRQSKRGASRRDKRDNSSAATSIGRASIIDWADNSSETARERAPLSGELSFMLPPVTRGAQEIKGRPAPGLDTADLLRYRPGQSKSPPPRSRAGPRHLSHGFRPPQNTPSRPDDFSASLRKSVAPRRVASVSGVVVLGGGIKPQLGAERWSSHREQIVVRHSRNSSYYSPREAVDPLLTDRSSHFFRKHRGSQLLSRSLGRANFELPMIDLKCVESPVNGLGNLEEKGIRLVRLRRVRRATKRKAPASQDGAQTESQKDANDAEEDGENVSNDEEEDIDRCAKMPGKVIDKHTGEADAVKGIMGKEKNDVKVTFTPRSTTSSASSGNWAKREAEEESVIGTNREPYLTPLLPNLTPQDTGRESYTSKSVTTPTAKQGTQLLPLMFTVEQATPTRLDVNLADDEDNNSAEIDQDAVEVYSESGPPVAGTRRRIRRSSSLLSVPTSDTSELRPRMDTQRTLEGNSDLAIAVSELEGTADEMTNRTIATQTGGRDQG
ncbi:hypothetical protein EGW08_022947 [Elysia chlorotica]|uniref:Uncharacterized protein n=1 Tax=Elysia chlorotica TaxID=188477 RepID=A0A433SJL1_ELYCH|nr:hypothetical protein EGW08_022947 [Elysia chlorotica]